MLDAAGFDPLEKNIRELQRAMAAGQLTSAQLVSFYLDRIAAYDQSGPRVNAVIAHQPARRGRTRARWTRSAKRRGPRGPLHGIPILLKDNFDTNDMPTTGGCLALSGHQPKDDAFQVKKLRDAGAVILGKVNLHELALGLTTVSSIGGQTLDPYDLTRAPGGSSGGSAVAATMNFAAATLGTDTAGFDPHPELPQQRRRPPADASASRAAPASFRSAAHRTSADRLRGPLKTSPCCSTRRPATTPDDPSPRTATAGFRARTPRRSDAMRSKARASAC